MSKIIALTVALGAAILTFPVEAAPLGNVSKMAQSAGAAVQPIDYKRYRHCHWRNGRERCHGRTYRRYSRGPSIHLHIGPRHGYHRGWKRGHRYGWRPHRWH